MEHYIDKSSLVAEIERYKHKADERLKIKGRTLAEDWKDSALQNLCGNLLHFLDTLEVKEVQEEPVSDDLKTLTYNYLRSYSKPKSNVEYLTFASCVANWQKEKDNQYFAKKTIETLDEVFEDGRDNMKQQMVDKACKYLQDHREEVETEDNGISGWISDEFIEKFSKYLEE